MSAHALALVVVLWSAAVGRASPAPVPDPREVTDAMRVVEIRSYRVKPGERDRFHELFVTRALPMLERWRVDVVGYGPSLHDGDSYYLMRSFSSLEDRARREDAFYGSEEWRQGPREAILAGIESYSTVVLRVDAATLRGLRNGRDVARGEAPRPSGADLVALAALNEDYLRAVETSDVRRFEEILAPDFLCTNSDGSLLDRAAFLRLVGRPATISGLKGHDVQIRIMGDVAIVHARTSYVRTDGRSGSSRYTDVWVRRDGAWRAVAAQVTRY